MSQPMRIAMISPQGAMFKYDNSGFGVWQDYQGNSDENGGQVEAVHEMSDSMVRMGVEVDIYARNYLVDKLIVEQGPGINVFHIPTSAPSALTDPEHVQKEYFQPWLPEWQGRMRHIVDEYKLKYDALIGHYIPDGQLSAVALNAHFARTLGHDVPVIGITHSLGKLKADKKYEELAQRDGYTESELRRQFEQSVLERFRIPERMAIELATLAQTDAMVCLSPDHKNMLIGDYGYPKDLNVIIPNGYNQNIFKPYDVDRKELVTDALTTRPDLSEETQSLIANGKIIFMFGRVAHAKNPLDAVMAMDVILEEHPDAVLVYTGGNYPPIGAEEKEVMDQCMAYAKDRCYEEHIVFTGSRTQEGCAKWLNGANLYMHCARLEPFGLAPLQATAIAPALLGQSSGVAQIMQNEVHALHHNNTPLDIGEQANILLKRPAFAKLLSQRAKEHILRTCTWDGRAKELVGYIKDDLTPRMPQIATIRRDRAIYPNIFMPFGLRAIDPISMRVNHAFADTRDEMRKLLSHPTYNHNTEAMQPMVHPDPRLLKGTRKYMALSQPPK